MESLYAGWTKDDPVIISARQVAFQQCLEACKRMTAELSRRSPERFAIAQEEIKGQFWAIDNIEKILRGHLEALDAQEDAQMQYELRTA